MRGWWRTLHQRRPLLARMMPLLLGVAASLVFVLPVVQPIDEVADTWRYGPQPEMWGGALIAVMCLIAYGVRSGTTSVAPSGAATAVLVMASMGIASAPALPWAMHSAWASVSVDVDEATQVVCEYSIDEDFSYRIDWHALCPAGLLDGSIPRRHGDLRAHLRSNFAGHSTFHDQPIVLRSGEALVLRGMAQRARLADPWSLLASTSACGAFLGLLATALIGVSRWARNWEGEDERHVTRVVLIGGFLLLLAAPGAVIALETVDGRAPGLAVAAGVTFIVAASAAWLTRVYRSERIRVEVAIVWPAWIAGVVAWPLVLAYCLDDAQVGAGSELMGAGRGMAIALVVLLSPAVVIANRRWSVMPR